MRNTKSYKLWPAIVLQWIVVLWSHPAQTQEIPPKNVKSQISVAISTDRVRFHPGEDITVHVKIRNEGDEDLFIFKDIDSTLANALATLRLTMYHGDQAVGPKWP